MKYKYKVCVYAICKNEEDNVAGWYESVSEADEIYVLDTGSTDNTVKYLNDRGVFVKSEKIIPWRFDVARNKSLEMVPLDTDICVCIDFDERFVKGWRKKMEEVWQDDTTRLRHLYNWKIVNDKPVVTFYYEKTHKRLGYRWTHPVHEILTYDFGIEKIVTSDEIFLNHYPDSNKSRGSYLELLELSVKEDPEDDRNMHYLGREYMYYQKWELAIDTLIKHLKLKKAVWKDERAASMRFIARSYVNLDRYDEAIIWYLKAIDEAPYLRDGYIEYAILLDKMHNYIDVIKYVTLALKIKSHQKTYINEEFSWDYTPYYLLSVAYFYLGINDISLYFIERALQMDKDNSLLLNNYEIIKNAE